MTAHGPIVGVLLAGGRSSRFGGGDKGLATLGGKKMIALAAERLGSQVDALVLNANGDPSRFAGLALPVIADEASPGIGDFAGPLSGLLAGMRWARAEYPAALFIVTAATDTPFFPLDLVRRLVEGGGGKPAVARSAGGVHPVFGLWPLTLADRLRADLEAGKRKALAWAEEQEAVEVWFEAETIGGKQVDPFFNINRADDLATAEALLSAEKA